MTATDRFPGEPPLRSHPALHSPLRSATRRFSSRSAFWFHLTACLVVWPVVFATVVIATFVGVVIVYNDPGGALFWPLAWIASAMAYGLVVGIPLAICGRRRRWYLRLIPALIAAVPFIWLGILGVLGTIPMTTTGVLWTIPSTATVALSILIQSARWWRPRG